MTTDLNKLFDAMDFEKREFNTPNSRVLIIDGLNTYIRCFSATPTLNDDGNHVGGTIGFLKSIGLAIRTLRPSRCIVVFDGKGGSQRRRSIYPEYKQKRKSMQKLNRTYDFSDVEEESDAMKQQLMILVRLLEHLPVTTIALDSVEADDVIAYASHLVEDRSGQSIIMSTDKDFLQLVNDKTEIWNPIKKKLYDTQKVVDEYGIHPKNFIVYRVLDGDNSDNIPGVKGIGIGTLKKNIPNVLNEAPITMTELKALTGKAKFFQYIANNASTIDRNYSLMRLDEVQMSTSAKMKVVEFVDNTSAKLNKFQLTKLFVEHKLWNSISNYDSWIQSTFASLVRKDDSNTITGHTDEVRPPLSE